MYSILYEVHYVACGRRYILPWVVYLSREQGGNCISASVFHGPYKVSKKEKVMKLFLVEGESALALSLSLLVVDLAPVWNFKVCLLFISFLLSQLSRLARTCPPEMNIHEGRARDLDTTAASLTESWWNRVQCVWEWGFHRQWTLKCVYGIMFEFFCDGGKFVVRENLLQRHIYFTGVDNWICLD